MISSLFGYQTLCLPEVDTASGHPDCNQSQSEGLIKRAACGFGSGKRDGRLNSGISSRSAINLAYYRMAKRDNKYTAVQMEEKKSKGDNQAHDLEEPFNEEFWLKVRFLLSTMQS